MHPSTNHKFISSWHSGDIYFTFSPLNFKFVEEKLEIKEGFLYTFQREDVCVLFLFIF
jgi:hypothetical protein